MSDDLDIECSFIEYAITGSERNKATIIDVSFVDWFCEQMGLFIYGGVFRNNVVLFYMYKGLIVYLYGRVDFEEGTLTHQDCIFKINGDDGYKNYYMYVIPNREGGVTSVARLATIMDRQEKDFLLIGNECVSVDSAIGVFVLTDSNSVIDPNIMEG